MRASRTLRQGALALVVFLLAACGGNKDDTNTSTPAAPTPSASYPATVPATAVVTLDGSGSTASSGRTLTYSWVLTSVPTGSVATIGSPTAVRASLTPDVVGTYVITLTVSDGLKSQSVPIVVTAIAPPTILSDLVEPVSGVVQLSLSVDQGTASTITWTVDGVAIGTGATVGWTTTSVPDGSHVVVAQVQTVSNYAVTLSRTFQVRQTTVSFTSATAVEVAGVFTAIVGAQSVNGILRVDATLDGVALGSLAAPNACVDPTGAACASTGLNGYSFSGSVASGLHVVVVTATDGIGNSLGTQLRLTVIDVP
jgi:hypothetical protein